MDYPLHGDLAGSCDDPVATEQRNIEEAMRRAPSDWRLRTTYFDLLEQISAASNGLAWAFLPELRHPLFFRRGTSDLTNMVRVFLRQRYAVPLKSAPRYILDLGAYVGYSAVYLANRFPDSEILCAEAMAGNFPVLLLNTLPYQRIACRNIAVWGHSTRLSPHSIEGGDAGVQMADGVEHGGISCDAVTIASMLQFARWPRVDLVKCDIGGGEASVFADPRLSWRDTMDVLVVACRDSPALLGSEVVSACFGREEFRHSRHGDIDVYERLNPFRVPGAPTPPRVSLIDPGPGSWPMFVQDVDPAPWGFFTFDGSSCQLHPNVPNSGAPARVIFPRWLRGQTRALATVMHAGVQGPPVRFIMRIEADDGRVIAEASELLVEGGQRALEFEFEAAFGRHRITLETEVPPGFVHNHNAWARWLDPRLA